MSSCAASEFFEVLTGAELYRLYTYIVQVVHSGPPFLAWAVVYCDYGVCRHPWAPWYVVRV